MTVLRTIDAASIDGLPAPTRGLLADVITDIRAATLANEILERKVTVGFAALTDPDNGDAQVVNIGAVLPAGARVFAHDIDVTTAFAGGAVSALLLDIGGTTDPDGILNALQTITDVPTEAELNAAKGVSYSRGIHAGEQLGATFTPDAGNPLVDLTAGSVTITLYFFVLPTPAP